MIARSKAPHESNRFGMAATPEMGCGVLDEHAWTSGDDESIIHVRFINSGGSGQVHEVNHL